MSTAVSYRAYIWNDTFTYQLISQNRYRHGRHTIIWHKSTGYLSCSIFLLTLDVHGPGVHLDYFPTDWYASDDSVSV